MKLPQNPTEVGHWLPHRAPMLLIDRVTEMAGNTLCAERFFPAHEVFFQGHFPAPDHTILPGVIVLEALAQAAALHTALSKQVAAKDAMYRFSKVSHVTWPAAVSPNSTVALRVEKLKEKLGFIQFNASARVGKTVVCEASFTAKVVLQNAR